MVSGNVRKATDEGKVIRLRVRGTGVEKYDELDVRIKNGKRAKWFKNGLGQVAIKVWWQSNKLYATFGELGEYKFIKVSTTSNHAHI